MGACRNDSNDPCHVDAFRQPPFDARWIYAYVGLLFLCGLGMGVASLRRSVALIHAVQLMAASVLVYYTEALNYRYWVKVCQVYRHLYRLDSIE